MGRKISAVLLGLVVYYFAQSVIGFVLVELALWMVRALGIHSDELGRNLAAIIEIVKLMGGAAIGYLVSKRIFYGKKAKV